MHGYGQQLAQAGCVQKKHIGRVTGQHTFLVLECHFFVRASSRTATQYNMHTTNRPEYSTRALSYDTAPDCMHHVCHAGPLCSAAKNAVSARCACYNHYGHGCTSYSSLARDAVSSHQTHGIFQYLCRLILSFIPKTHVFLKSQIHTILSYSLYAVSVPAMMVSQAHHGVVLLEDLHIINELVLFLGHSLVMHAVEVALLPELVPGCRCLHA